MNLNLRLTRSLHTLLIAVGTLATGSLSNAQLITADKDLPFLEIETGDMIDIFAHNNTQRQYAERFTRTVCEAAYETTGEPAGKGLIVIGSSNQPHPYFILRDHLDLARESPNIVFSEKTNQLIDEWDTTHNEVFNEVGVEIDALIVAFPMPLEDGILDLYLLAVEEEFDEERISEKLKSRDALQESKDTLDKYDWAVYLPQRNAIDKVIKKQLPAIMKKHKVGFIKRKLARGAVFTFKPLIKDALEGVRKSILYESILKSTSDLSEGDIKALAEAYRNALMPKGKILRGGKEKRALAAIEEQKLKNIEYAKDPYIAPEETIDFESIEFQTVSGEYAFGNRDYTLKIYEEDSIAYLKSGNDDPRIILPASDRLFVTEDKDMTIEFTEDENGFITTAELRGERWRKELKRLREEPHHQVMHSET